MNKSMNDNTPMREADEAIFSALIKKSAHEYLKKDIEDHNAVQHDSSLSHTCDHKLKSMIRSGIRKQKRRRGLKRLPRVVCAFLAVVVVFSVAAISVEAVRIKFLNLMILPSEIVTDITVEDTNTPGNITGAPRYMTPGYQFSAMDEVKNKRTLIYTDAEDNEIRIKIYEIGYQIGVDTQDAVCEDISINGNDGFYSVKNHFGMLVFETDVHAYLIIGKVDVLELKKIAESIT